MPISASDLPLEISVRRSGSNVRTGHGTTDWFQIGKGVCQSCILSPCLFNLYAEYTMRNTGLEEAQAGIKIARRNINNLRYADYTTLMADSSGGRAGRGNDRRVRDGCALSAADSPPHGSPWADWEPPGPVSAQPRLTRPGPGWLHGPQDALSPRVLWKCMGPGTLAVPDGLPHGPGLRWA